MIADWLGVVWKKLPWKVRLKVIRATQAKFTVSAAVAIMNGDGKVLLLDHRIRPRTGWGLPGGFLEFGEHPNEGIRREVREETELELTELTLRHVRTVGRHLEILFSARAEGEPRLSAREIKGFAWFTVEDLPEHLHASQQRFIREVVGSDQPTDKHDNAEARA